MRLLLITLLLPLLGFSQFENYYWVHLDTMVIKVDSEFKVEDFIDLVQEDTSFYKAFKNLSLFPHTSKTKIEVFDDLETKASLNRTAFHHFRNDSSWITIEEEKTKGKYYRRNGSYRYYTSMMFDKVFFELDTVYQPSNQVSVNYMAKDWDNRRDKHYEQLKQFVFSPGTKVEGVPIIKDKLAIFSDEMRDFYNFKIEVVDYKGISCYKFTCEKKETTDESDVVIQFLHSYFDRKTMNVIKRDYLIKHNTVLFDFEIFIDVNLHRDENDNYLPIELTYKGWWSLPLKQPEVMDLKMVNTYWK